MSKATIASFDNESLLRAINKAGFVLEERTRAILTNLSHPSMSVKQIRAPFVIDKWNPELQNVTPVEVDAYLLTSHVQALIECKRTEDKWVFARHVTDSNVLNILYEYGGYKLRAHTLSNGGLPAIKSYKHALAVECSSGKCKTHDRAPIYGAVQQSIAQVEALLQDSTNRQSVAVLPTVVTNAELYTFEIDDAAVDRSGDMTELKNLAPVSCLAFTYPKRLTWDKRGSQVVRNMSGERQDSCITIFIVNIAHLFNFLVGINNWIEENRAMLIRSD